LGPKELKKAKWKKSISLVFYLFGKAFNCHPFSSVFLIAEFYRPKKELFHDSSGKKDKKLKSRKATTMAIT